MMYTYVNSPIGSSRGKHSASVCGSHKLIRVLVNSKMTQPIRATLARRERKIETKTADWSDRWRSHLDRKLKLGFKKGWIRLNFESVQSYILYTIKPEMGLFRV